MSEDTVSEIVDAQLVYHYLLESRKHVETMLATVKAYERTLNALEEQVGHLREGKITLPKINDDDLPSSAEILFMLRHIREDVLSAASAFSGTLYRGIRLGITSRIKAIGARAWDAHLYHVEAGKMRHVFRQFNLISQCNLRDYLPTRHQQTYDYIMTH